MQSSPTIALTKEQFDVVQLGAFEGGMRMAEVGAPRTACPYMATRLRDAWFAGYDEGAQWIAYCDAGGDDDLSGVEAETRHFANENGAADFAKRTADYANRFSADMSA